MKNRLLFMAATVALFSALFSCTSKEPNTITGDANQLNQEVLSRIAALGFSTDGAHAHDGGYIVENDIFLSNADLDQVSPIMALIVGNSEQYRTTNLVTGLPRVITVALDTKLGNTAGYDAGLQEVVDRYNAENLQLTFQKLAAGSSADIRLVKGNGSFLASAGFPTSTGNPYNQVKVNSTAIGSGTSTTFINYVATIMAHEIGHCIGFRHTDYMNRAYSCGGAATNEGASTVGAVHIPGTPTGPDAGSWMLACIGSNQNRPFNANDVTALGYLY